VADALVLAALADGIVLVVGAEMVPRRGVQHTLDRLRETGARVLGALLNRAQLHKPGHYYYGHYYGHYQYSGYGYGENKDQHRRANGKSAVTPIRRTGTDRNPR